jgi:MAF protein
MLGLEVRTAPTDIDETTHLVADPLVGALSVATAKLRASDTGDDEVLLTADTLVVLDGQVLGKPMDGSEARSMLAALRDRAHQVMTGVALLRGADGAEWGGVVTTRVEMRAYEAADVERYIARGEPFDKAGGYAVQDTLFAPVSRIDGCYLNVVGLPLCAVAAGLRTLGIEAVKVAETGPPCGYCTAGATLVAIGAQDPERL